MSEVVLNAFEQVPRHRFVPLAEQQRAYGDHPLPIGNSQTISQPFVVAYMLQALDLQRGDRVLEIGTGSGYQTALLAEIVDEIFTIECIRELARSARATLISLGHSGIRSIVGNGSEGWPGTGPTFDAIVSSAAPPEIPPALLEQLADGGRMVIPVGTVQQQLILVRRHRDDLGRRRMLPVRFVPLRQ